MEVGKTYEVKIQDCCVWGSFTSKLIHIELDEDGEPEIYVFDNGVRIGGYRIADDAKLAN